MKFLLDVCASSGSLRRLLISLGHDVLSVVDVDPRASDTFVLDLALRDERVLVTEDKDFGNLIFVHGLPHRTIVRFVEMRVDEQMTAMRELLDFHVEALQENAIIVVTRERIRIRGTPGVLGGET